MGKKKSLHPGRPHECLIYTHQFRTQHKEALDGLKLARSLSIWFHQSFGKQGTQFKSGPFVPPQDPSNQLRQLQSEIEKLKSDLTQANVELNSSKQLHDLITQEKAEYEALAVAMDEESKQLSDLAAEHESELKKQKKEYEETLQALQKQLDQQDEKDTANQRQQVSNKTRKASQQIVMSEELTRILIDQQLIESGWTADSQELTYKNGTLTRLKNCQPILGRDRIR